MGPLMADALYPRTASFDSSLMVAAVALVIGSILCLAPPARSLTKAAPS
nr:hypothetical protein [Brucella rhizosphaerae]